MKLFIFSIILFFLISFFAATLDAKHVNTAEALLSRDNLINNQKREDFDFFKRDDDDDEQGPPQGPKTKSTFVPPSSTFTIPTPPSEPTSSETTPPDVPPIRDLDILPIKQRIYPLLPTTVKILSKSKQVLCEVWVPNTLEFWYMSVSVTPVSLDRLKNISYPTKTASDDLSHIVSTAFNIDIVDDQDNVFPAVFNTPVKFSILVTPEDGMTVVGKLCLAYIDTTTNQWVCQEEFVYNGEEYVNATTNHFTEFAVLIVPQSSDTTKELFNSNHKVTSIVICSVVAGVVVFSIMVGIILGLYHRNQKKEEANDIRLKSEKIAQTMSYSPSQTTTNPPQTV